ncbi:MAG: hypothetical protein L6R43_19280, partial [Planctomycetes bacterium]|nr:hypothetical protein [Planctomycetota bacterium]
MQVHVIDWVYLSVSNLRPCRFSPLTITPVTLSSTPFPSAASSLAVNPRSKNRVSTTSPRFRFRNSAVTVAPRASP